MWLGRTTAVGRPLLAALQTDGAPHRTGFDVAVTERRKAFQASLMCRFGGRSILKAGDHPDDRERSFSSTKPLDLL